MRNLWRHAYVLMIVGCGATQAERQAQQISYLLGNIANDYSQCFADVVVLAIGQSVFLVLVVTFGTHGLRRLVLRFKR